MGALGTDMLLIGASSREVSIEQATTDLADAAARAKARGMRLAYLALPWAGSVQTDAQALDLIQQIDSPNLGLALNSYFSLADGAKLPSCGTCRANVCSTFSCPTRRARKGPFAVLNGTSACCPVWDL